MNEGEMEANKDIPTGNGRVKPYKTYKGYIIAPGITMPSHGIHDAKVFNSVEDYEHDNPLHTSESEADAMQWVDQYLRHDIVADIESAEGVEKVVEAIREMPFMPEKGAPLPEYVAAELYPSPTWDLMKAPVSDYGKVIVEETARLLKEFMRGGNFELKSKFEEGGWSSEDIIYMGDLAHTPTGAQYLTEINVFFAWRDPTKDVIRTITLFEEKPGGPEDIWGGDLSYEDGQEAGVALSKI